MWTTTVSSLLVVGALAHDDECGSEFCYGHLVPELAAFELPWADLVLFAAPAATADEFGYVEDSQARRNVLEGFDLNNQVPNDDDDFGAVGYT